MTTSWDRQIEADLAWRELELAVIKKQAVTYREGTDQRKALLRSLWCICYAHFEGFTKFCWEIFVDYVARQGLRHDQLSTPLLMLALEGDCQKFRGDTSTARIVQFVRYDFPRLLVAPISKIQVPSTESNLWASVYQQGCSQLGIVDTVASAYSVKINSLVGKRNAIAHGASLTVATLSDYQEHEDAAFTVMHSLGVAIVDSISTNAFRSA